jgi:N-acetylglucosamine-6-phosphate deacetylase
MPTLTARRLLTHLGTVEYPIITISPYGLIEDISSDPTIPHANDTLTPTFLDIHTHGAVNHDVMSATPQAFTEINKFLATKGVGRYLPTTVTAPIDTTLRALESIAKEIDRTPTEPAARPIAIHLEGPFISHAKRGVHPPQDILPPDIALFDRFRQAARNHIRLITIAPETPGALDLIRHCASNGVKVSLGHSNATTPETLAAIAAGATSATHTFNAMRPLDHRSPGILGTVLDSETLYAELICDLIHVAPELVRLWLKAKGPTRAILVTDAISATGMPDGPYTLGTLAVTVANGRARLTSDLPQKETLAGSILTMDRALTNLMQTTNTPLTEAIHLATTNPATLLSLPPDLQPGSPAHFNRYLDNHLTQTILGAP